MIRLRKLFFLGLLVSGAAYADVEREVIICGVKENNLERLQCYDKIARLLNSGVRIEELYDYETAAKPVFSSARQGSTKITDKLESRIAQLHKLPHHRYQITLEDGQVWREIEGSSARKYKIGDMVTIKEGLMGSFSMVSERSGRRVKVKPVN